MSEGGKTGGEGKRERPGAVLSVVSNWLCRVMPLVELLRNLISRPPHVIQLSRSASAFE